MDSDSEWSEWSKAWDMPSIACIVHYCSACVYFIVYVGKPRTEILLIRSYKIIRSYNSNFIVHQGYPRGYRVLSSCTQLALVHVPSDHTQTYQMFWLVVFSLTHILISFYAPHIFDIALNALPLHKQTQHKRMPKYWKAKKKETWRCIELIKERKYSIEIW